MPTDIDCSGMVYAVKDADGKWVTGENYGGALEEYVTEQLRELNEKLRMMKTADTVLLNSGTFMMMMATHRIEEKEKEFYLDGLRVVTSPYLPEDKAYLTDREHAEEILEMLAGNGSPEETGPKKEPKTYHCRVCGRPYADRAEAKECMRNHDWQNRRERR